MSKPPSRLPSRLQSRLRPERPQPPPGWVDPLRPQQPLVTLRWLAGAFTASVLLAVLCAFIALCLLFYQGEWQLVFHPSSTITATPATAGLRYDDIRFDDTEQGQLLLDGWWIPAQNARFTVLYLHGGRGSLSDTVGDLDQLHQAGVNAFAFDYRGFGRSAGAHPSEQRMNEDADAAWTYLTATLHIAPASVILCGSGLGASIAASMAARHQAAALVIDNPQLPALALIARDPRSRLVPARLLARDRFDPGATLATLASPKLFLSSSLPESPLNIRARALYAAARGPKQFVEFSPSGLAAKLAAFLNQLGKR